MAPPLGSAATRLTGLSCPAPTGAERSHTTRVSDQARQDYESAAVLVYAGAVVATKDIAVHELDGRNLHLVKKALAIAVLTIQRSPDGPFRSDSDMKDMKDMKELLDSMIVSDVELKHYAPFAQIAVMGKPV